MGWWVGEWVAGGEGGARALGRGRAGARAAPGCAAHVRKLAPPPTPLLLPSQLLQLVLEVMGQLEGAYALLIKSSHYPGELVACKRGSPLILGVRAAAAAQPLSPTAAPLRPAR